MAYPPTAPLIASHSVELCAQAAGRHILLVDESVEKRSELTRRLSDAGFSVGMAGTAVEALEKIQDSEVELILLGERLPGMSGLDLLRLLRAAWTPQQLPVIMLANGPQHEETSRGEGPYDLEMEALEAGANDCLAVSVDSPRTLARVQSQLRQKDSGQGIRDNAERIFRATAVSTDVIWEWNIATDIFWFSADWGRLSGRATAAGPARLEDWMALVHPEDVAGMQSALLRLRDDPSLLEFGQEYRMISITGVLRWIYCRAKVERDRDGRLLRLTGLQTDITRNKSVDWLTQLPNREHILAGVDYMLGVAATEAARPFGLLLLDLDRFRVINESLGAAAGDRLLREVALRLERATRTASTEGRLKDCLARVHGDRFILILSDVPDAEMARCIVDRLQGQIRRPFLVNGREVRLSASIGIVMSHADAYERAFELLRDAEIALRQAKALGRARSVAFEPEMRRDAILRMDLEIDLRYALDNRQFELYYQPKVSIVTGELEGFEALIRWRHPRLGLIGPLKFIPIAEETGLIIPIGAWAMEESARQFALWRQILPDANMQVSVNLSVKQFFDRELVDLVSRVISDLALPRGAFCLEVTESVFIGEMQAAVDILRRLHEAGAGLMIDDFGTGYSSLNYLSNLPFDALKIDRSFVSRLRQDEGCAEVVKAVIALASNLKMDVIAEGVETLDQLQHLLRIGCCYAQGYYFAKPVDAATATGMVLASRRAV